jgi:hypothetical protein
MTSFTACVNCGRYVESEGGALRYCSKECATAFSTCLNCGRHFKKGEGLDENHCSKECTVQYVIMRKYGPEPVTIVAEV